MGYGPNARDISTVVLHDPLLVESMGVGPQVRRAAIKVICRFSTLQRVGTPNPHIQGSAVYLI